MPPSSPALSGESVLSRQTADAATIPKTNCEAMNQGQFTPLRSRGLTTPSGRRSRPSRATGSQPPHASGLGNGAASA